MDKRAIIGGIHRSWTLLGDLCLQESFPTPQPLAVEPEFRDAAFNPSVRYDELYSIGLRLSHYNLLLFDRSYLQFSWSSESCVRYAFYPNPYRLGIPPSEANVGEGDLDADPLGMEEMPEAHGSYTTSIQDRQVQEGDFDDLSGLWATVDVRVPLIRYENAPDQRRSLRHPCSHLHIGHHSTNRWALNRVLTPEAFTLLICKHYYSDAWFRYGDDASVNCGNKFEFALSRARTACHLLGHDLFDEHEVVSFHFA